MQSVRPSQNVTVYCCLNLVRYATNFLLHASHVDDLLFIKPIATLTTFMMLCVRIRRVRELKCRLPKSTILLVNFEVFFWECRLSWSSAATWLCVSVCVPCGGFECQVVAASASGRVQMPHLNCIVATLTNTSVSSLSFHTLRSYIFRQLQAKGLRMTDSISSIHSHANILVREYVCCVSCNNVQISYIFGMMTIPVWLMLPLTTATGLAKYN